MKKLIVIWAFIAIGMNACGYKGDLYLPPKSEKPVRNASAPAVNEKSSTLK